MEVESAKRIWETALGELQIQVSRHNYQTWLEKTTGLSCRDNQFVVRVPNAFVAEYLDKNQRSLIERTLIRLTRRDIRVLFEVDSPERSAADGHGRAGFLGDDRPGPQPFNPKYTFDSFVTGSGNLLAYSAALGVARNPGQTYNPLFIYGGVGLGKTHLLHAIGHIAAASYLRVCYASCERFTNEFITALQERQMETFRRRYRGVDMLMIDDIHFISGKEQTEECLFHTFNELHDGNRQIIVTSDRAPKSIPRLAERLRSRFEWGLVADIHPPDLETRLAILQAKAREHGADVPLDSLELIARQIQQNIRELEGSLNRVIAYARLLKARATPEVAAEALEHTASENAGDTPGTPAQIIDAVARSFQLSAADLSGLKRDQETAQARQIAMFLIREQSGIPLAQIGLEFGKRNPSTVRHACEKIAAECDANPHLRRRVSSLREQLRPK
ncbi:MAG: chromosomal replication initiator protein DnaA [Dehalococcoidales bacterium]|nr:chromosomal replication initiator protein DnaA [Dehalococcoidales bacterium]